jgi:ribosomal protein L37AE/L43A
VTPVRYSDLPLAIRARIDASNPAPKRERAERSEHSDWRCAGCGEVFTAYAPAERHSTAGCHGSHRLDLVMESEAV